METVLVVEDHSELRDWLELVLKRAGFNVLTAPDGKVALAIIENKSPVSLVLTDIVMEGVFGDELAKALEVASPRTPILFMSAHTPDSLEPLVRLHEGVNFIRKPFTAEELLLLIKYKIRGGRKAGATEDNMLDQWPQKH